MGPAQLASLAAYAGRWLHDDGPSGPRPFGPTLQGPGPLCVYIICAWSGRALYVGSTTIGVSARFAQHLRDRRKTMSWSTSYLIPLQDLTPLRTVRRIEGRVGVALRPEQNRALPRICE